MSSIKYPENSYSQDLDRIDQVVRDKKISGLVSEELNDFKIRWRAEVTEEELVENLEERGLETGSEALGRRLENGGLLNYTDGILQYSSTDGDISALSQVLDASTDWDTVYAESFAEGLSREYRWLEK